MIIVGYAHSDGYVLCDEHGDDDDENQAPIFDDSAWDYIPTCDVCGIPLDVTLTSDGFKYHKEYGQTGTSYEIYQQVLDVWYHNQEEQTR